MQFKLKCALLKDKELRIRATTRHGLAFVTSCILLAIGLGGCHPAANQPPESDQVQFAAQYLSTAERLLNQGFSDRDAAQQAQAETIESYRGGSFRALANSWQSHVSIETLPDGARRISILLKQPSAYAKSEVYHLVRSPATQGDPKPLTR